MGLSLSTCTYMFEFILQENTMCGVTQKGFRQAQHPEDSLAKPRRLGLCPKENVNPKPTLNPMTLGGSEVLICEVPKTGVAVSGFL